MRGLSEIDFIIPAMVKSFVAGVMVEKSIRPSVEFGTNAGILAQSLCRKAVRASTAVTMVAADTGDVSALLGDGGNVESDG